MQFSKAQQALTIFLFLLCASVVRVISAESSATCSTSPHFDWPNRPQLISFSFEGSVTSESIQMLDLVSGSCGDSVLPVTWFVDECSQSSPELIREMLTEGHEIGVASMSTSADDISNGLIDNLNCLYNDVELSDAQVKGFRGSPFISGETIRQAGYQAGLHYDTSLVPETGSNTWTFPLADGFCGSSSDFVGDIEISSQTSYDGLTEIPFWAPQSDSCDVWSTLALEEFERIYDGERTPIVFSVSMILAELGWEKTRQFIQSIMAYEETSVMTLHALKSLAYADNSEDASYGLNTCSASEDISINVAFDQDTKCTASSQSSGSDSTDSVNADSTMSTSTESGNVAGSSSNVNSDNSESADSSSTNSDSVSDASQTTATSSTETSVDSTSNSVSSTSNEANASTDSSASDSSSSETTGDIIIITETIVSTVTVSTTSTAGASSGGDASSASTNSNAEIANSDSSATSTASDDLSSIISLHSSDSSTSSSSSSSSGVFETLTPEFIPSTESPSTSSSNLWAWLLGGGSALCAVLAAVAYKTYRSADRFPAVITSGYAPESEDRDIFEIDEHCDMSISNDIINKFEYSIEMTPVGILNQSVSIPIDDSFMTMS